MNFILMWLLVSIAMADNIDIDVASDKVLLEEQVTLVVKVETDSENEPLVNVDAVNANIVGQEFRGLSTSTIYNNGNLTSKREYVYAVTLQAKALGRFGLTNISADINGKIIRHQSAWITAVNERQEAPPVLLIATASKTRVYQNEGIVVRYYVLSQVDLVSLDIKEFPKLNNFMKRYLQEQSMRERVNYEGKNYLRQLLYSVVVFPEIAKPLKIDAMKVQVSYDLDGANNPFGIRGGRISSKLLMSKSLEIEVVALPLASAPTGFTGLVGKHQFALTTNKTKVLVNEPLEFKLTVTGPGNLESLDPPEIITSPEFESFDTNSALDIANALSATKKFEYTYLPRKEIKLPAQKIPFAILNSETRLFETVEVEMPAIEVVGGIFQGTPENNEQKSEQMQESTVPRMGNEKKANIAAIPSLSGALFDKSNSDFQFWQMVNIFLTMLLLFLFGGHIYLKSKEINWHEKSFYSLQLAKIKDEGLSYAKIEELLLPFPKIDANLALKNKISLLNLARESKVNLNQLIDKLNDQYETSGKGRKDAAILIKNYWRDLKKLVASLEKWEEDKNDPFSWSWLY